MAIWSYRALTAAGRAQAGVVDADTARAAWQVLRTRGVYPTELAEDVAGRGRGRRVRAAELAATTRELATLLAAGVPLADALAGVAEHLDHPTLGRALTTARARLREGASLAEALGASPGVFPPLFRDLVRAGEESGALAAVLRRLASHTEAEAAMHARIRAALAYPAVMTLATTAVLGFVLAWVVPQTTALFAATGKPLPFATHALATAGSLVARFWWLALGAAGVAAFALRRWLAGETARRRLDAALLRMPGLRRLIRATAAGRLARTLATLLAGGVPLEAALGIAGPITGNRVLADAVGAARARVREGETLAPALRASGAFPPVLVQLVAVGERSGGLADALAHAADAYEAEVQRTVAAATALVEPALILAMGGVVLVLVTAVLLPLFELGHLRADAMERRSRDAGFTLLEIMIVVFIVGLLATLVAPRLMGRTDEARRVKASADLATIAQALDLYRLDSGAYPTTPQGLAALVTRPSAAPVPLKWREGGYVDQVPPDPWGNAYVYVAAGDRFVLKSLGADGVEGGEGNAADVEHH